MGDFKFNVYKGAINKVGELPKPIMQISTQYYDAGARLSDIKGLIEQAAAGNKSSGTQISPDAFGPAIKIVEVSPIARDSKVTPRESVSPAKDGNGLVYSLFGSTIRGLGEFPSRAVKQRGWQTLMSPQNGFWVRLKA
jgi:hypothetical protein